MASQSTNTRILDKPNSFLHNLSLVFLLLLEPVILQKNSTFVNHYAKNMLYSLFISNLPLKM